jgi:hypothetical protein
MGGTPNRGGITDFFMGCTPRQWRDIIVTSVFHVMYPQTVERYNYDICFSWDVPPNSGEI